MKKYITNANRVFILITFSHAEKRGVDKKEVLLRILECFQNQCVKSILIAQENHEQEGYHYHAAVCTLVSRYTFIKEIRNKFPEFEGAQLDVKTRKSWAALCEYVMKEDKDPILWGEDTKLEDIKSMIKKRKQHKKSRKTENTKGDIIKKLRDKKEWYHIYDDQQLTEACIRYYSGMRAVYEDLQVVKEIKTTVQERITAYLHQHENPREYDIEDLKEKYLLLDWIACQLCFGRPIKTKQMYVYGKPSTQKTLIFFFLAKVLKIYFASARRNDFTGAHNYYDLWLFDEFHEPEEGNYGAFESGTPYFNTLLRILDGQECRLDSKYSRVFTKTKNVPIVMMSNEMPRSLTRKGPLQERFMRLCFRERILNLKEERVIATLWGCMQRRKKSSTLEKKEGIKKVNLAYNHEEGTLFSGKEESKYEGLYHAYNGYKAIIKLKHNDLKNCENHCTYCEENGISCINEFYLIEIERKEKEELTLIDFLTIPLKKIGKGNTVQEIPVFEDQRYSAFIFRKKKENEIDYAVWPTQITYQNSEQNNKSRKFSHDKSRRSPATILLSEGGKKAKENKERINGESNNNIIISIEMGPTIEDGEWQK